MPLRYEDTKKISNAFGIYDMSGNVWEWCNDWYSEDYYANSPFFNPMGPPTGSFGILRGGGYMHGLTECRAVRRRDVIKSEKSEDIGFRIVRRP